MADTAEAQRRDMMTSWAWAWIDESWFRDPQTGAMLPPNVAHPRGEIKDRGTPDSYSIKMIVTVVGQSGDTLDAYTVVDGQAVYRSLERRITVSAPVGSVRFELCTVPAAECVGQEVPRPVDTLPSATPTPVGGQPGTTPTLTDRDGDGVIAPADCSDTNSSVHPGAPEIPGNALDDDCVGGDQAAKMPGGVVHKWTVRPRTGPRVRLMRVRDAVAGATVTVDCRGRGCPFKQRRRLTDGHGSVSLTNLFKRRLRHGVRLDVSIAAPNMITKVVRFDVRRGVVPTARSLCVPANAVKPEPIC